MGAQWELCCHPCSGTGALERHGVPRVGPQQSAWLSHHVFALWFQNLGKLRQGSGCRSGFGAVAVCTSVCTRVRVHEDTHTHTVTRTQTHTADRWSSRQRQHPAAMATKAATKATGWPWGQPGGTAAPPLGTGGGRAPLETGQDLPSIPWHLPDAPNARASWDKGDTGRCRDRGGGDKPPAPADPRVPTGTWPPGTPRAPRTPLGGCRAAGTRWRQR